MKRIREMIDRAFRGRYGLDELGKTLVILALIIYLAGVFSQSGILVSLSMAGILFAFYRVMSRRHWDRSEENRKYMSFVRLWKLKYENRKEYRIFMCRRCGKYIRVPKGKGKIQVTCTACGDKSIHRT